MIKKISELIKKNWLIIIIIAVGMFLRSIQLEDRFSYGHDQDLASWFVKDVLINGHLRLIGQETSTQGIFIGPLYYYLLIPFLYLFGETTATILILRGFMFFLILLILVATYIFSKICYPCYIITTIYFPISVCITRIAALG